MLFVIGVGEEIPDVGFLGIVRARRRTAVLSITHRVPRA